MSSRVAIGTWLWGRVFTFWLSHIPYLVITDADAVQVNHSILTQLLF